MASKPEVNIVVMRVKSMPKPLVKSVQRDCGRCDNACWADVRTIEELERDYTVAFICTVCLKVQERKEVGKIVEDMDIEDELDKRAKGQFSIHEIDTDDE